MVHDRDSLKVIKTFPWSDAIFHRNVPANPTCILTLLSLLKMLFIFLQYSWFSLRQKYIEGGGWFNTKEHKNRQENEHLQIPLCIEFKMLEFLTLLCKWV